MHVSNVISSYFDFTEPWGIEEFKEEMIKFANLSIKELQKISFSLYDRNNDNYSVIQNKHISEVDVAESLCVGFRSTYESDVRDRIQNVKEIEKSEQFDITKDVLKIIKVLKNKISTEGKKYINEANLFTFK